jgi:chromosome segregation ATPase
MSNFSFLEHMGIAKMGHIGDQLTTAIINFDPTTASEVDIATYKEKCDSIEHKIAESETAVATANTTMTNLQAKLDRACEAGKAMKAAINAATDNTVKTQLIEQANVVMTQIKQVGGSSLDGLTDGDLFDAKDDLARAQTTLTEWKNVHVQMIGQLKSAQGDLKHAQDDIARAQRDKERAQARARQEEADAGLRSGLGASGTSPALAAMQAKAAKLKEDARAATIHADAVHQTTHSDADSIIADVLAKGTPAPNVLDDLNKL